VSDFVGQWVSIAEPARAHAMAAPAEQRQSVCEHAAVRLSLDNLMTFPWIKDAVEAGHTTLHGCFFDIRSGVLEHLGEDDVFHPIPD
jgi:carbonic anhydrase